MNKKMAFLAFIGLLGIFAVAFGLDRWVEYGRQAVTWGDLSPFVLLASWSLSNLILALCILSLSLWAFPRLDAWAVILILIIGLLVDCLPVIYSLPLGSFTSFLPQLMTNRGYLVSAGGWVAVASALALVRRRSKE